MEEERPQGDRMSRFKSTAREKAQMALDPVLGWMKTFMSALTTSACAIATAITVAALSIHPDTIPTAGEKHAKYLAGRAILASGWSVLMTTGSWTALSTTSSVAFTPLNWNNPRSQTAFLASWYLALISTCSQMLLATTFGNGSLVIIKGKAKIFAMVVVFSALSKLLLYSTTAIFFLGALGSVWDGEGGFWLKILLSAVTIMPLYGALESNIAVTSSYTLYTQVNSNADNARETPAAGTTTIINA